MRKLISVRKEDVENSIRAQMGEYSCWSEVCPIAQAIRRIFPNWYISVGFTSIDIDKEVWKMPAVATKEIFAFDRTREYEGYTDYLESFVPFSFYITKIS